MSDTLQDFITDHATRLTTLDPQAPLDDLEPLRDLVGTAKVVAIGENNHHVREFYLFRHRLLRFLVERCGFTAYGLESGFTEGVAIDAWVHGGPGDLKALADHNVTFTLGRCAELRDHLRWMREVNTASAGSLRFSGLDVPASAGSALPALEAVAEYLRGVDPEALPRVERIIGLAEGFASESSATSPAKYAELDLATRDGLTAELGRLLARFDTMRAHYCQRSFPERYTIALRHLRGAWYLDHYLRELMGLLAGTAIHGENSSRDVYMAENAGWLLDSSAPDARIAIAVHNGHLQRTPLTVGGMPAMLPMGYHLADRYGEDYLALAVTCGTGETAGLKINPESPRGFDLHPVPLDPPQEGSIEAAFAASSAGLSVLDLRTARRKVGDGATAAGRLRHADQFVATPVLDAFDAVVHIPTVTCTEYVRPGVSAM